MRGIFAACWILAGFLLASPARADVSLTIDDGRVTLVAKDATLAQIMVEWARVGQTKVINGERLTGPPVTLELNSVPEEAALGIILRSASGYLVAPREGSLEHGSRFNRILILPTSSAPRPSPTQAPAPAPQAFPQPSFPQPAFAQPPPPQFGVPPAPADDQQQPDTDLPPQNPVGPAANPRGPVFQTFPGTQPVQQQPPQGIAPPPVQPSPSAPQGTTPPAGASPTVPPGVSTPGMLVPAPPQQPGQPPQPSAPPDRRPGD
jgi:hypothetical protein